MPRRRNCARPPPGWPRGEPLAACGGSASAAGRRIASLTLYSGQHQQTTDTLVAGFEKATGITVKVRSDDEDVFANQIVTEGSRSPADVFFTENSPVLAFLQARGCSRTVDAVDARGHPGTVQLAEGDWVGVSARVSVLIYNPALISASQLPTAVLQLADPKYKGKLAIAPRETDFQPIVTSVRGPTARRRRCAGWRA